MRGAYSKRDELPSGPNRTKREAELNSASSIAVLAGFQASSASKRAQSAEGLLDLGTASVVGVVGGVTNPAFAVDYVPGRNRKTPAVVTVLLGEIDSESEIDLFEIVGKGPGEMKLIPDPAAFVVENLEVELALLDELPVVLNRLG